MDTSDVLTPRCGYCESFIVSEEGTPYPMGNCSNQDQNRDENRLRDYHNLGICEHFELKPELIRNYTCAGCRSEGLPHSCHCSRNYSGQKDFFNKLGH
ncbi:MAG: hypothetical protein ACXAC7_05000 [Candidatus Hodarchaeales archaeon]|jgi:hypothetical protein